MNTFVVADALGFERSSIIGQSMGGSVANEGGRDHPGRLDAVVLVDVAGRVDRGAGEFIASAMAAVHDEYESVDADLDAIRGQGAACGEMDDSDDKELVLADLETDPALTAHDPVCERQDQVVAPG